MSTDDSGIARFADRLQKAVAWMDNLGIRVGTTRFAQYLKQLRDVISDPGRMARTDDPQFELILEAFDSGAELIYIHREFTDNITDEFLARLKAFAKGTYLQRKENPSTSSNRARNHGFELYFGAQLARAGFNVEFPKTSDLQLPSPLFRFECKRPQSLAGFEAGLKDARDQLGRCPDKDESINVIAISVGKLLHQGSKFLHVGNESQLSGTIDVMLANLRNEKQHVWRNESFAHVLGVGFHYSDWVAVSSVPAVLRGTYGRIIVLENGRRPDLIAGLKVLAREIEKNGGFEEY